MPRILLVEDNELNRDMLSRRLLRKGFEVVMAVDGREAITRARSEAPDLILMDMSLPEVDGWQATRTLKADEATRAIPIVALTAHAMAGDRARALDAGCDDFDTKPVDLERLLGKIGALLSPARPAAPTQAVRQSVPARIERLRDILATVDEFCAQAAVPAPIAHDLRLIVEESCANVIRHAYADRGAGELTLELERSPWASRPAIRASILDQGIPFNPLAAPDPDLAAPLADRPIGGLGVLLLRRLSDEQHYGYDPARGNRLTLVRYLDGPGDPAARAP